MRFPFLRPLSALQGRDAAWWTIYGGSLATGMMLALLVGQLYVSREETLAHAIEDAQDITLIIDHELSSTLASNRMSLDAMAWGATRPEILALPPPVRDRVLFGQIGDAPHIADALVLGPRGDIVLHARAHALQDADALRAAAVARHGASTDRGIHLHPPVSSESGPVVLAMSQRIDGADGAFAGVAVLLVNVNYFDELLRGVNLGTQGSVSIRLADGTVVVRQVAADRSIRKSGRPPPLLDDRFLRAEQGQFRQRSPIDGVERFYVYRRVTDSDFVVVFAPATQDILRTWKHRTVLAGGGALFFAVVALLLFVRLSRELRARGRAERELHLLATTDPLTDTLNRRALTEALAQAWPRMQRAGSDLSLLFVDIDYFKRYNDTYGHQAGDAVLSTVAREIRQSIHRPDDQVARYGGEEFLVLLPETSPDGALRIAQALQDAVRALDIPHSGSPHRRINASIGVATHRGGVPDGGGRASAAGLRFADADALIQAADTALYHAKGAGRDTIHIHRPGH